MDCEENSFAYFFDPPAGWANPTDCGNFPCTGPKNTIYDFKNVKFEGIGSKTIPTFFDALNPNF